MKICSTMEKCKFEIRLKIKSWGYTGTETEEIINELIREKFIDELRFATFFANDKFRFNKWGRIKIRYELTQKQIPSDIIETALEKIDDNEYNEILVNLLESKAKSVNSESEFERNSKLIKFAQSKGFEYEEIRKALKSIN